MLSLLLSCDLKDLVHLHGKAKAVIHILRQLEQLLALQYQLVRDLHWVLADLHDPGLGHCKVGSIRYRLQDLAGLELALRPDCLPVYNHHPVDQHVHRAAIGAVRELGFCLALHRRVDPVRVQVPHAQVHHGLLLPVHVPLACGVLLEAVDRRFLRAAIGVTRVLESQSLASSDPLPPSVRTALVRALETPNVEVRFFAAKALAKLSGPPPFAGSSRLIETLLWCASSRGIDRAVVAHPSSEVANSIASGLSRFGYRPQVVSTGRAAILAVRDSCDVRLILLASRINRPESFETAQLIRTFTPQEILPTLIVVDPLDDENDLIRERLACVFDGIEKLSIVDRMDDFFYPRSSDAGVVSLPRFPVVMQTLSPQGDSLLDDRTTAAARRRERGKVSLELLASLAGHGWDLSATLATARLLMTDPACATAAISLLAHSGKPAAQHALLTEALRPHISANHASACVRGFKENVRRYGILLESGEMLSLFKRYNNLSISENPVVLGKILDILEASGSVSTSRKGDGA